MKKIKKNKNKKKKVQMLWSAFADPRVVKTHGNYHGAFDDPSDVERF